MTSSPLEHGRETTLCYTTPTLAVTGSCGHKSGWQALKYFSVLSFFRALSWSIEPVTDLNPR
jgi:hypothetical protein